MTINERIETLEDLRQYINDRLGYDGAVIDGADIILRGTNYTILRLDDSGWIDNGYVTYKKFLDEDLFKSYGLTNDIEDIKIEPLTYESIIKRLAEEVPQLSINRSGTLYYRSDAIMRKDGDVNFKCWHNSALRKEKYFSNAESTVILDLNDAEDYIDMVKGYFKRQALTRRDAERKFNIRITD